VQGEFNYKTGRNKVISIHCYENNLIGDRILCASFLNIYEDITKTNIDLKCRLDRLPY
jgi:hypothetical protein